MGKKYLQRWSCDSEVWLTDMLFNFLRNYQFSTPFENPTFRAKIRLNNFQFFSAIFRSFTIPLALRPTWSPTRLTFSMPRWLSRPISSLTFTFGYQNNWLSRTINAQSMSTSLSFLEQFVWFSVDLAKIVFSSPMETFSKWKSSPIGKAS